MDSSPDLALAGSLAEAARVIAAEDDLDQALKLIVTLATESVVCEGASITLRLSGGEFRTLAPTDPRVNAADKAQYELGQGPCISATFEEGYFLVDDLSTDTRWPLWSPRAVELGLHSILSMHLYTTSRSVGALNLYGRRHHHYTDVDVELARVIAAHASTALARLRVERDLWAAIDSRHLIGQAQGILMEQRSISAEESFALLQRCSQHTNRKLREVAEELVSTRVLPDTPGTRSASSGSRRAAPQSAR